MDKELEEMSLYKETRITGTIHKLCKEWIHVDKIKMRYCFTNKGTRCKSWVENRDYDKERIFMYNWLHPQGKDGPAEKKSIF